MSDNSTRTPNFKGKFFTTQVTLFTNREKGLKDVLLVFSSGKREAVREYLWLKFLWSQLSSDEYLLFLATLSNKEEKKWAFLRLLTTKSKKLLRRRLIHIETLLGEKDSSKSRLEGYYRLRIEIRKEVRRLPKVPKFSGYIKSPSAVGTKSLVRRSLDEMVGNTPDDYEDKITWYYLLSVDSVPLFLGQAKLSGPDEN